MLSFLVPDFLLRVGVTALTAFAVSLVVGAWLIRLFHGRRVIEDTTQPDHAGLNAVQSQKKNVPTMGGLMIIAAILAAVLLWSDLRSSQVWIGMLCLGALGVTGFVDDYIKLVRKPSRGLSKKQKLLIQFILGGIVGYLLMRSASDALEARATQVWIPFARTWLDLGWGYILWAAFVMAATSNAVNLTDGLDGLAGGCVLVAAIVMAVLSPVVLSLGGVSVSWHDVGNISILCAAVAGAVLGFLWYNCHPAQIFMGDTGSLTLGGLLAYAALAPKLDLLLLPVGIVFFLDELTVAMQIAGFKLTRKRIFPITPIHHYFQVNLKWPEQKITARFWIVGIVAAIASLMALAYY